MTQHQISELLAAEAEYMGGLPPGELRKYIDFQTAQIEKRKQARFMKSGIQARPKVADSLPDVLRSPNVVNDITNFLAQQPHRTLKVNGGPRTPSTEMDAPATTS